jgi:hypothetical protein
MVNEMVNRMIDATRQPSLGGDVVQAESIKLFIRFVARCRQAVIPSAS